jgi:type IV pilus assembly protein PilM
MNINTIFKATSTDVYGLDVGSKDVRIVALKRDDNGYIVTGAGISQIVQQPNAPDGENVINENKLNAIKECLASVKLHSKDKSNTKYAVCGVSGPEVAVRDFDFPAIPEEEITGAVFYEASLVCPFNIEQAAVDYQLISGFNAGQSAPGNDGKTRGILVAATNNLLTEKVELTKKAGLKCVLMDVDGLALLNCFNNTVNENQRFGTAILNVGGSYTTMAAMSDSGRPFIRDINSASKYIISHIMEECGLSSRQIEQMLFDNAEDNKIQIDKLMEKACEKTVTGIADTLKFYAATEQSTPIGRIFICGSFAPARGFVELVGRRLGLETLLWNPFNSMRCNVSEHCKEILDRSGHTMAVAVGLAMRSVESTRRY